MPPLRVLSRALRAAGRFASRWIATAFCGLIPGLAGADHGAPVLPPRTGLDWMSWLLVAGAVAAVGLAAWAFFAPDRAAARPGSTPPDRSEPERPAPPAR
jgi:hypothetical protein